MCAAAKRDDAFASKIAIVTGGASGIGRALAEALCARGATVVVADIAAEGASEVARAISAAGGAAEAASLDVTDGSAVRALVERVAAEHGRLDLMFNNAGIAVAGEVAEQTVTDFERLVDVNIKGVVYGCHAAYQCMLRQRHGHIVNTASIAGLVPVPLLAGYAMTKHAVVGLSTSLRIEAAEHRVRVSAVCPGIIGTPMLDNVVLRGFEHQRVAAEIERVRYPVERCAADILRGVARNRAVIVVTSMAKTAALLQRFSPTLTRRVAQAAAARQRAKMAGDAPG